MKMCSIVPIFFEELRVFCWKDFHFCQQISKYILIVLRKTLTSTNVFLEKLDCWNGMVDMSKCPSRKKLDLKGKDYLLFFIITNHIKKFPKIGIPIEFFSLKIKNNPYVLFSFDHFFSLSNSLDEPWFL